MDERWAKIERIFNRVLETQESRRGAVLKESCAGDESLRREVESLLAHITRMPAVLSRPPRLKIRVAGSMMDEKSCQNLAMPPQ